MVSSPVKTRSYSWYFPTVIILIIVIGIISTGYTYISVTRAVRASLLERVSSIALALDPDDIFSLEGGEADLQKEEYLVLKGHLMEIREANRGVRFIYLTGYRNGNPFFFADSEPSYSEDYSPPGQIYEEASPVFRSVFIEKEPIIEGIFSDRWGTWLTGLSPVIEPRTGEVIAVLGMDMDAHEFYRAVFIYSALPAVGSSFILIFIIVGFMIRKREERFVEFKSELVSIASHEIRTPLSGIAWLTESLLQRNDPLTDAQRQDIVDIKARSRGLLMTINDLLDLSVAEKTKPRKLLKRHVTVLPFLRTIIENFELSIREKSIAVVVHDSITPETSVYADEDRLRRIFNNLLSNAVKYSREDGQVQIGCKKRESSIVFWIEDKGIGIPTKDLSRIFDGFYRAENARQVKEVGTGLGLRYVRQVVEQHGGRVWCESTEGVGSTFFVELPNGA